MKIFADTSAFNAGVPKLITKHIMFLNKTKKNKQKKTTKKTTKKQDKTASIGFALSV
jgi:hypothetical protein